MISVLNRKLFTNDIKVIELYNGNFVYPIYKNATVTLSKITRKVLSKDEIKDLTRINVYIRDPYSRFLSGVESYITHNNFDRDTVIKIVNDIHFFNKHFAPQLFWIINLSRFTNANLKILDVSAISELTDIRKNVQKNNLDKHFKNNSDLLYYLQLDSVLYENFMNQVTSFTEIFETLKTNYNDLYRETVTYTKDIIDVLP